MAKFGGGGSITGRRGRYKKCLLVASCNVKEHQLVQNNWRRGKEEFRVCNYTRILYFIYLCELHRRQDVQIS
jgi:hypothetical protein